MALSTNVRVEPSGSSIIVVLKEDNYNTWKWHMSMILKSKGLFEYVTGKSDTLTDASKLNAATVLASALSQTNMERVINCKDAPEIWKTLESMFENKSASEKAMLYEKLTSFKMHSVKDISTSIPEIQTIVAKLNALDAGIKDEFTISIILKALPASMRAWKTTWLMIHALKPNINELITGLMAEVALMEEDVLEDARHSAAFLVHDETAPSNHRQAKRDTCNYCKKEGHWVRNCNKLQQKTYLVDTRDEDHSNHGIALMATDTQEQSTQWVADSGCCTHMTPNRNWIDDYKPFKSPKMIRMGDNRMIQAEGYGNIQTTIGVLLNVYYVPLIGANLFSISSTTSRGVMVDYNITGVSLWLDGKRFLKGHREHGLYLLDIVVKVPALSAYFAACTEPQESLDQVDHLQLIKDLTTKVDKLESQLLSRNKETTIEKVQEPLIKAQAKTKPIQPDHIVVIALGILCILNIGILVFTHESIAAELLMPPRVVSPLNYVLKNMIHQETSETTKSADQNFSDNLTFPVIREKLRNSKPPNLARALLRFQPRYSANLSRKYKLDSTQQNLQDCALKRNKNRFTSIIRLKPSGQDSNLVHATAISY